MINTFKILKTKNLKNGKLEILQASQDMKILVWLVDGKVVRSKCFVFPKFSFNKTSKLVSKLLNSEWRKWYNQVSKFGYLESDDSLDT